VAAFLTARRIVTTRRDQQGPQSVLSIFIVWISPKNHGECLVNVVFVKIVVVKIAVVGMLSDKSCGLL
jgi:hypothetical protein